MQKTLINVILLFLVLSERTTIPPLKQRNKGGKLGATIVQQLKFANQQIESNGDLTDKELEDIMDNLNAVSATIASYKEKVKAAKKAKLEAEIRRMQSELEKLD